MPAAWTCGLLAELIGTGSGFLTGRAEGQGSLGRNRRSASFEIDPAQALRQLGSGHLPGGCGADIGEL